MFLETSYALFRVEQTGLGGLLREIDFDRLEPDPSHPTGGRYRRYSELSIKAGEVLLREPRPFVQPDSFGYQRPARKFAPLVCGQDEFHGKPNLLQLIKAVSRELDYDSGTIAVHAIRVCARRGVVGIPVPEGLHRDGFRWVGILVCDAPSLSVQTRLISVRDAGVLDVGSLRPGELLLFSDRDFLHYTAEFSTQSHEELRRDVLVLTVE